MEAATTSKGATSGGNEHRNSAVVSESNSSGKAVISSNASNQISAETVQGQRDRKIVEENFKLVDSLYHAAANGETHRFKKDADFLKKLLTPMGNTILHIHIAARPQPAEPRNANSLAAIFCLMGRSGDGFNLKNNFVRDIISICPDLLWMVNQKGDTLLHMAARHGHADIAEILIAECKKLHQNDQERAIGATRLMLGWVNGAKDTALHEAVQHNHVSVVKILTRNAPDLSYRANKARLTPLYLAAGSGHSEIVKAILETCDSPVYLGPKNRTDLHAAVLFDKIDVTKQLLDKMRFLTSKADELGNTPLHYAAWGGFIGVAKEILKIDESAAYKRNAIGAAPIHLAALDGRVSIMEQLMLKCPDCFELVDSEGRSVLHYALHFDQKKAVEFVIQTLFVS